VNEELPEIIPSGFGVVQDHDKSIGKKGRHQDLE
jgi:hypothetical protein